MCPGFWVHINLHRRLFLPFYRATARQRGNAARFRAAARRSTERPPFTLSLSSPDSAAIPGVRATTLTPSNSQSGQRSVSGRPSNHPHAFQLPVRTAQRFRASEQPPSRLPTPSPDSAAIPGVRIATPRRPNITTISPSNIHHNTCCRFSSHDILSHKFQIHFSDTKQMQLTVPLQRITQPAQLSSTRRLFQ